MNLTDAEWNVMECLWEKSPRTGRETTDWLEEKMGWSRSTTLTLLRRMEKKGAVAGENDAEEGMKLFRPLIQREDAALEEAESFLSRVYHGSVSQMVNSLTQKQALPQEEIDELYELLKMIEEGDHHDRE